MTESPEALAGNDERVGSSLYASSRSVGLGMRTVVPIEEAAGGVTLHHQFAERHTQPASSREGRHLHPCVKLQVLYGEKPANRLGKLQAIADWLADWAGQDEERP
jgi:hypothetical protein